MTTQDLWGGDRVWTINRATGALGAVLLAKTGRTQFRLDAIREGDVIVGYDVVPINLPEAWTVVPCRFFCRGSIEPQWPPFAGTPPKRPLPSWEDDPKGHGAVADAMSRNCRQPSTARLEGDIHTNHGRTAESITLYKIENAVVGGRAFLFVDVRADAADTQSGIAHGNN